MRRPSELRHLCRLVVAAAVAAIPLHVAAQGCGPTRLKVSGSVSLDLTPERAWALVGDFQNLAWDAEVSRTHGVGGNLAETASRTVTLKGGATMTESLYRYDAARRSYSWHVDALDLARLPVQNVSATIEVVPAGDTHSIVRVKAAFYRNLAPGEGAPDAADAAAVAAMTRYIDASLAGLKAAPPS